MAKPRLTAGKKRPVKRQPTNLDLLRKALGRLTKSKLTELFIRLAQNDRGLQRTLEAELKIEECLLPVIKAVGKSELSPADVFHWCGLMLATDRVGFICREELCKLQASFAGG